ncbi:toxic anion resistance protein [Staphylococcus simiae]|uniref:toxic anion resistance protein n=1 Tax=Staphylococcus simiae TaxID=308354 RepID=UPI001A959B45|nr:toxic anion resistance protein [Staphylococcus simiae]MBO1197816.1 toxic anion resistance protein [Staphylococcus simiae]MBO1200523.1 toxic anion resistance protein [Staphylococcus simiae]MBO1202795.1 toxic anion resistance protein [Staphylococcus simiae]MBO1211451.1 toxic anion resistance protein [Staphylococcus simiae]MBO1230205.1 toxic anion resistance protein [Staphylococcus simiae]
MLNNDKHTKTHPLDDLLNNNQQQLTTDSYDKQQLSIEEQQKVDQLSQQIETLDHDSLLSYGAQLQQHMSHFSHQMLDDVQTKNVGPVGDTLSHLMAKLKTVNPNDLNPDKQSKFKKLFTRAKASVNEIFSRMQSVSAQIDRITIQLQQHQDHLSKDIELLNQLYDKNKVYFDDLTLYIIAAQQKKNQLLQQDLPKLQADIQQTSNQMEVQRLADMEQFIDRLDKRIYDLQLSRQIAIQTAPQIRMIQNVDQALAEKIQSSILTSIPLWKNQMAIALTLMRQRNAVAAQRAVTDTTNDLLTTNAAMLKQNALETATENERGIVDIETLKTTQQDIIDTIEQTLQIQQQGRENRQQAEQELQHLENDLKQHLITMKRE